jgi:hypothetical protein
MSDLVDRALNAKRESKYIEFKERFDPGSMGEWCEVIKDIAAIANSGGGIIVFGLDNTGNLTRNSLDALSKLDPADIANKISRYVGSTQVELEVRQLEKDGVTLYAFVIQPVSIPIVFQKPGIYDTGAGKQKTAFSVGTVYFRHGAKSEPGTSDDLRGVIERQLEVIRHSWIKGVRKVVQAPAGSQIIAVRPGEKSGITALASTVRVVNDPSATPVLLTRARDESTVGTFVHEEGSEGIFDEINNVIDANRVLARGNATSFSVHLSITAFTLRDSTSNRTKRARRCFFTVPSAISMPPRSSGHRCSRLKLSLGRLPSCIFAQEAQGSIRLFECRFCWGVNSTSGFLRNGNANGRVMRNLRTSIGDSSN